MQGSSDMIRIWPAPWKHYGAPTDEKETLVMTKRLLLLHWRAKSWMTGYPEVGSEPTESLRPLSRRFVETSWRLRYCANERFCNGKPHPAFMRFGVLQKVLHYWFDWRYICAMLIGYARVSTDDQDTAAQAAALKAAACERIFREKASGGRWDRPELHRLLDQLRKGDVLKHFVQGFSITLGLRSALW